MRTDQMDEGCNVLLRNVAAVKGVICNVYIDLESIYVVPGLGVGD